MVDLITEVRSLIGAPPAGYEFLEYLIVSFILLWLLNHCVAFIASIFQWVGGKL